jgi:hypothetical protein
VVAYLGARRFLKRQEDLEEVAAVEEHSWRREALAEEEEEAVGTP